MPFEPTPEQARAIRTLDRPLSISAGAGSGKTRVLAERFVAAADPSGAVEGWAPIGIDQALTVTFTEKAAGEIAERVRRVFLEHGLVAEARRVDESWISTIHGLCSRLLRTHALEAGLDPQFGVITTVDARALREEVFEALLRDELSSGRSGDLVAVYGVGGVEDHVACVYDRLRAMGAGPASVATEEPADPVKVLECSVAAVRDWLERLRAVPSPGKTLLGCIDSLAAAAGALGDLSDGGRVDERQLARETLRLILDVKLSKAVGGAKETVVEILAERDDLLDAAVRALAVPLAADLLRLVEAFAERYETAKAKRGVLDFEDLQLRAVALLRDPHGPAARYRELFRLVMIDEFQDTNEVQTALADLLSDGTLCTVGDERQSIYGFRYADVGVYRRHTRAMAAHGAATVELAANFRSHGDVLAFVNGVFSGPALFGDSFLCLEHGRDENAAPVLLPPGEPRVEMVLVQRGRTASVARSVETEAVARRLRELVDAGVPQGEMVVLLRAMTHADEYAAALRRYGLDYTIVAGGSFFGRPEVEAVRAFLRAASNPLDDEALAHVLASGIGGVSDDALLRLRDAAGREQLWEVLDSAGLEEDDAASVGRVRAAIEAARGRQGRSPVAEIIHRACEETDYDLYLLAQGADGRHAYTNVLKLARIAAECEANGAFGVRHFLEHLALKERFRDREAPASVIDERADAVRITTVHAAKGLEFPVVAVPELGRDVMCDKGTLVLEKDRNGARIALSLPDGGSGTKAEERRSLWTKDARARSREREIEEEKRLFYVACTRAREFLLLSGTGDIEKGCGDRPLGWLLDAVATADPLPARTTYLAEDEPLAEPPVERARDTAAGSPTCEALPGLAAPATRAPAVPPAVSHSALALYEACPLRYLAEKVVRVGRVGDDADGPLRFGEAVHAALRLAGPAGRPPAPERLAAIARYWGLDAAADSRLRAAVDGYGRSGACRDAFALGEPAREVPFAVPLDGATLVGTLDLLVRGGERALVVDYKTGADAIGADARQKHRGQADRYALAVLAGGSQRVDITFVGVETDAGGQPREVTFSYGAGDVERLRSETSAAAAALAAGPYDPLGAYAPATCDACPVARSVCPVAVPDRSNR